MTRPAPATSYADDGHCPKCGHDQIATRYQPAGCHVEGCRTCNPEALVRTCRRCAFRWEEATRS